jgi:hypothetical protein
VSRRVCDGRSFKQGISNPALDDREAGQRDRYRLNLATAAAQTALGGQTVASVRAIEITKAGGTDGWRCTAVGLRVNGVVLLSRYANHFLDAPGASFRVDRRTDSGLDGLELRVQTGDFPRAAPMTPCTATSSSRTARASIRPRTSSSTRAAAQRFRAEHGVQLLLPLPASANLAKTAADIEEVYLRKEGNDGWLLQSARLYADGNPPS